MEYFYFVLFILALIVILFLLFKYDARIKSRYKKTAYRLLEMSSPDVKEIRDTIKGLRLYGGRIRKDKETVELIKRLQDKFAKILY